MRACLSLIFISLALVNQSCSQEGCDLDTEVYMHAGFYETGSGDQINVDSLTIYGLGMSDSLIYSMAKVKSVNLPLKPTVSSCSFIIINGNRTDTVELIYEPEIRFLSSACGYIYLYELEEVNFTRNDINIILIENKTVNPGDEENIQIFF